LLADGVQFLDVAPALLKKARNRLFVASEIPAPALATAAEPPPETRQRHRSAGKRGDQFQYVARPLHAGLCGFIDPCRASSVGSGYCRIGERSHAIRRHVHPTRHSLLTQQFRSEGRRNPRDHPRARLAATHDDHLVMSPKATLRPPDAASALNTQVILHQPLAPHGVHARCQMARAFSRSFEAERGHLSYSWNAAYGLPIPADAFPPIAKGFVEDALTASWSVVVQLMILAPARSRLIASQLSTIQPSQ